MEGVGKERKERKREVEKEVSLWLAYAGKSRESLCPVLLFRTQGLSLLRAGARHWYGWTARALHAY